jgi:glycosyltransferase involved in cell wall biosynthesis
MHTMTDRRPPRVLMIVDVFPPEICGIGDYSACLARAMAERGVGVRVLTKAINGAGAMQTSSWACEGHGHEDVAMPPSTVDGFDVRRIGGRWGFADFRRVLAEADAMGPETIIHVQYPSRTGYGRRPMINLLPALVRIARPSHKIVVTMHEYHEHRLRWRARVLPMLLGPSALIAVRSVDCRRISSWLRLMRPWRTDSESLPPVAMVPVASNIPAARLSDADRQTLRRELGLGQESLVLTFFGDVRPDKGVHSLLDAAQAVRRQGLDVRVLVIGAVGDDGIRDWGLGIRGCEPGAMPTSSWACDAHGHEDVAMPPPRPRSPYQAAVLERIEAGRQAGWAALVRGPDAWRVASLLHAADLAVFPFTLGASENRTSLLAATANGLPVLTTRGPSTPPGFEAAYGVATVPAGDQDALVPR